jgi:hypothetical protein
MKKLFLILLLLSQIPTAFGNNQNEDPTSKKIIGYWYMNENRNVKWIFTQDGKVYNYNKDAFQVMYKYSISHSCGNNSSDTIEFITLMDKDGNEFCFRINKVNENKNGILSLTKMDNMQTLVFVNDINIKTAQ